MAPSADRGQIFTLSHFLATASGQWWHCRGWWRLVAGVPGVVSLAGIPLLQPWPWFHLAGSPRLLFICEA